MVDINVDVINNTKFVMPSICIYLANLIIERAVITTINNSTCSAFFPAGCSGGNS